MDATVDKYDDTQAKISIHPILIHGATLFGRSDAERRAANTGSVQPRGSLYCVPSIWSQPPQSALQLRTFCTGALLAPRFRPADWLA